jgi:DeoR/GlpR family transcriptional regulator of sugar metabolism
MKVNYSEKILNSVNENGFVSVAELSEKLDVTEVTIRTHLNQLEKDGKLNRVHGGACKKEKTNYEPSADESDSKNYEIKLAIAKKGFELINDGDAIVIDTSSTCRLVAQFIKNSKLKDLVVITNSFRAHSILMKCDNVTIIHIGGITNKVMEDSRGNIAINSLKSLRASKAFIGSNGIDKDGSVTCGSFEETNLKLAMMEISSKNILLLDSTKFRQSFVSVVANINHFDYMITDDKVEKKYISEIDCTNCEVLIAPTNEKIGG